MTRHTKRALTTVAATLLMATAVTSTATARVFSLSNMNFRTVWTSLEFMNNFGFGTVRCRVTFEGSFHSQTISKVERALIGHISRATVAESTCTGGRVTIHQESLPWQFTYRGFVGILPSIERIHLSTYGARLQIRTPLTGTCTATTEVNHQARYEIFLDETGQVGRLEPEQPTQIPITGSGCPTEGFLAQQAEDGRPTLLGTTTRIMVTLI